MAADAGVDAPSGKISDNRGQERLRWAKAVDLAALFATGPEWPEHLSTLACDRQGRTDYSDAQIYNLHQASRIGSTALVMVSIAEGKLGLWANVIDAALPWLLTTAPSSRSPYLTGIYYTQQCAILRTLCNFALPKNTVIAAVRTALAMLLRPLPLSAFPNPSISQLIILLHELIVIVTRLTVRAPRACNDEWQQQSCTEGIISTLENLKRVPEALEAKDEIHTAIDSAASRPLVRSAYGLPPAQTHGRRGLRAFLVVRGQTSASKYKSG